MSLVWWLVIIVGVLGVPFTLWWWWIADSWVDPKLQRFNHGPRKRNTENQVVVSTKDLMSGDASKGP